MYPQHSPCLCRASLALAALLLTIAQPMSAQEPIGKPIEKKTVPSPAAQSQAEALITKLFAAKFKQAKTDKTAALALAADLLAEGKATKDDDSLQFVALKLASELAASGGDNTTALEAIAELSQTFKIDTFTLKSNIFAQVERGTTSKDDAIALSEAALHLIEEALAADNFDIAAQLIATATKAAEKSEKLALIFRVEKRGKEVEEARKALAAIKPLLAKAGKEEQATLAVGKYYCFIKGNFDKGLPLLAKSSDATLKELAERDLAKPSEPRKQADLADDWYKLAEAEKGLMQRQTFRRAGYWYREALPKLEGLTKIRVGKVVEELALRYPVGGPPTLVTVEIVKEVRSINVGGALYTVTISKDGKLIATGGNGSFGLWDATTGQKLRDLVGHNNTLITVAISADKKWVLSGGTDNTMRLWNLDNGQEMRRFAGHANALRAVLFMPNGKQVLSSCDDGAMRLFDLNTGNLLKTIPAQVGYFTGLAVSKDGKRALSCGSDKYVRIWDLEKGTELQKFMHDQVVQHGTLSADGKRAVTTGFDNAVKIWDADTGKALHTLPHPGMVWCVAISPDGRRVYTGCGGAPSPNGQFPPAENTNCNIRVFDMQTGKELRKLEGHSGHIYGLSLSADGRALVSASLDGTVRLWGAK